MRLAQCEGGKDGRDGLIDEKESKKDGFIGAVGREGGRKKGGD